MNIFASVLGSIFEMYIGYMFFSKFGTIKGDINKKLHNTKHNKYETITSPFFIRIKDTTI